MIAFDAAGNLGWSVPNYTPHIATADGGLIATSDSGSAVTFDDNGNATGQIANLPIYSWTGNWYQYGSVRGLAGFWYYLGASFWTLAGGQYTIGTAGIPIDSIGNKDARDILTPARWQQFAKSNCSKLFANPQGLPLYDATMRAVQIRQRELRFYDVGNPDIGDLTLQAVTAGRNMIPSRVTLTNYLRNDNATAAVPLLGRPGPVVLAAGFFSQPYPQSKPYPQFTLVHEVLLHAYLGLSDGQVLGNPFLVLRRNLWRGPDSGVLGRSGRLVGCRLTMSSPRS
jgi:hypothetical protein